MQRFATAAMGTRFELVLAAGGGDPVAAGEAALAEIHECHARFSRFAADSLVSHIARSGAARAVRLDRHTFELFADALAVWRASEGAFDITVAPLMAVHGHGASAVGSSRRTGSERLELDEERWTITVRGADVGLDFGAIAKGHALDLAAAVLRDAGVTAALMHGGTSSVVAIGAPEGARGWPVAVKLGASRRTLVLRDAALSVSDPSSHTGSAGAPHVMDPRADAPVSRSRPVAVQGPSARLCDAWSTALAVLGRTPDGFPGGYTAIFETTTP
ncbi:MAG TPA: FAD:protein FMN transferase [Vicinamibacterales bacterium]|nr:FAD:protein FMN transferase [Vicinamibacterales bacterium]